MLAGVAVEELVGGNTPEVEVDVVFPGDADAAVDLDAVLNELG